MTRLQRKLIHHGTPPIVASHAIIVIYPSRRQCEHNIHAPLGQRVLFTDTARPFGCVDITLFDGCPGVCPGRDESTDRLWIGRLAAVVARGQPPRCPLCLFPLLPSPSLPLNHLSSVQPAAGAVGRALLGSVIGDNGPLLTRLVFGNWSPGPHHR